MKYEELIKLRREAWQAFFDVFRANDVDESQLDSLRKTLNYKDCYNDVEDCLVEVFCNE